MATRRANPKVLIGLLSLLLLGGVAIFLALWRSPNIAMRAAGPGSDPSSAADDLPPPPATARAPGPKRLGPPALRPSESLVDPSQPDYDPVANAKALGGVRRLFREEPRDEVWAGAVEKAIAPLVEKDLMVVAPDLRSMSFACRTTTCAVRFDVPPEQVKRVQGILQVLYGGSIMNFKDGQFTTSYAGGRSFQHLKGDAAGLVAQLQTTRRERLTKFRAGKAPPHVRRWLQPAEWPPP